MTSFDNERWVINGNTLVFLGDINETEDNIRLVNAAPEMYELLEDTLAFLEVRRVYGDDDFALQAKSIKKLLDRIKGYELEDSE